MIGLQAVRSYAEHVQQGVFVEPGKKKLKLNSISQPDLKRILKPCEARAGHGFIILIAGLAFLGMVAFAIVKILQRVWGFFI